jgi:hypothetical protein
VNTNRLVLFFSILYATASLPFRLFVYRAADQVRVVSSNHHRRFDDLHGCRNQVSEKYFTHIRLGSSPTLVEITVSKFAFSVYCDDGLMVRSIVNSCFMC